MIILTILTIIFMFFISNYSFEIAYSDVTVATFNVSTYNIKYFLTELNLDTFFNLNFINSQLTLFDLGIYDIHKYIITLILCFIMGLLIYLSLSKYGRNPVIISLLISFSYIFTIQYAISFIVDNFSWITTLSYFTASFLGIFLANAIKYIVYSTYKFFRN